MKNGEILYEITLSEVKEAYTFSPCEGVTLLAEKDGIAFLCSDCANQTCVKTGKCSKNGDKAVCIPNGILIAVTGQKSADDPQVITY